MDLLNRLKTETKSQHQQTEAALFADKLMAGRLSRLEYGQLLSIHYGFHQALETAVASQSAFFSDFDLTARRKTPWLVADLHHLNLPLPTDQPDLFANWTGHQLLGALYVAEGSTLGGRFVAAAIRRTPALANVPLHFFTGYGEQTGPYWKAFGTYLTNRAYQEHDLVIDAAERAFGSFQHLASALSERQHTS